MESIGAVLARILVGAVLSLGTDVVLHVARVFPPWNQPASNALLLLATAYRTVYSIAGGYATARLAPNRPMVHALVLGALGLVVCILGAVATWNKGATFGPHWYPVAHRARPAPMLGRRQALRNAIACTRGRLKPRLERTQHLLKLDPHNVALLNS